MKINGITLNDVMLNIALGQFQSVPREADIDHSFSPKFQENIQRTNKKSKSAIWRFWQAPAKRAMVIAVLIIAILATIIFAIPTVRIAIMGHFTKQTAHIPQVVETYYIPTFEPEGIYPILQRPLRFRCNLYLVK